MDHLINHPGLITAFGIVVIVMLLLDLGVFNKNSHVISNKEALVWSVTWISISMIFSGFVYYTMGIEKFSQFQSAYWIEKALSVDNLFVFIMVFRFFNVPRQYQHKVLFWGIVGALILRAFFIFVGVELIKMTYLPEMSIRGWSFILEHTEGVTADYEKKQFFKPNIILTLFGIFLIYAGIKSWFTKDNDDNQKDFTKNLGARVVYRFFNTSNTYDGAKFFTFQNGKKLATPLFIVLAVIEFTDLLFAVDSIPAIFAIAPDDPFILYTSNIFAILGLRSLYFLLSNFIYLFNKLKYGLAIILAFIGTKMIITPLFHFTSFYSLLVIGGILIGSIIISVLFPEHKKVTL